VEDVHRVSLLRADGISRLQSETLRIAGPAPATHRDRMPSTPLTQEQIAARRAVRRQRRSRRGRLAAGLGAFALVGLAASVVVERGADSPATAALTSPAQATDRTPVKRTPAQASHAAASRSRLGS
jgi:hypothetical protein